MRFSRSSTIWGTGTMKPGTVCSGRRPARSVRLAEVQVPVVDPKRDFGQRLLEIEGSEMSVSLADLAAVESLAEEICCNSKGHQVPEVIEASTPTSLPYRVAGGNEAAPGPRPQPPGAQAGQLFNLIVAERSDGPIFAHDAVWSVCHSPPPIKMLEVKPGGGTAPAASRKRDRPRGDPLPNPFPQGGGSLC
jgi:hypothetical protein